MQLLLMLVQAERDAAKSGNHSEDACIAWDSNGRAVIIRNKEQLINTLLPEFFCKSKFSSFTRKLYRWGFRQVMGKANSKKTSRADEIVFCHPLFQRDNKPLMMNMKSVTAEGTKRAFASQKLMTQQEAKLSEKTVAKRTTSVSEFLAAGLHRQQDANSNPYQHYLHEYLIRSRASDRLASIVPGHLSMTPHAQVLAAQGRNLADIACLSSLGSEHLMMQLGGTARPEGYVEVPPLQALLQASGGLKREVLGWSIPYQVAHYSGVLPRSWHLG